MRLIVIGGGAAGFFCAVTAARLNPSLEVVLVEKSSKLLSKVRISGGGRCNVTHACFSIPEMAAKYPRGQHFVKKTFHEFFTTDTIEWFSSRGVQLKTEEDGRMFPISDSSETIVRCLLDEASRYRVSILLNRDVVALKSVQQRWQAEYANGSKDDADFVCVACGGFPKASQFRWIKALGHSIAEPVPSLFTFNIPNNPITSFMGISAHASVKIANTKFVEEGPVLITHWGLSGPGILKLSARAARELHALNYRFTAVLNWSSSLNEQAARETFNGYRSAQGSLRVHGKNSFGLPQRLWEHLCTLSGIADATRWADLTANMSANLAKNLCSMELPVQGKTTYKEEFVTAGGIVLKEVNHLTMESRIAPNLFFAGEILDVDGVTGGFNFQHAWTSGFIAGKAIAQRMR